MLAAVEDAISGTPEFINVLGAWIGAQNILCKVIDGR